ncbi:MAG: DUF2119 family protein [Nitrososphaerales archaeon]
MEGLEVREYNSDKKGITRLIIGGLHGREHYVIKKIFDSIKPSPSEGRVIIIPNVDIFGKKYISTTSKDYINSPAGRIYLSLLKHYKPDVVVELHVFKSKSYKNLVSHNRIHKKGVPRLVPYRADLPIEDQILHGGPAPFIKDKFKEHGSYITLEVHERYGKEAENTLLFVLNSVINSNSVKEIRDKLKEKHKESMEEAARLLQDYIEGEMNARDEP